MLDIIASIVTYNNNIEVLSNTIESFLKTSLKVKLVLVDNSQNKDIEELSKKYEIDYLDTGGNIGFGRAHNKAIQLYQGQSKYFLILNPDVVIHENSLEELNRFLDKNKSVVLTSSVVRNPDQSIQRVHKRLPSFMIIFARRFLPGKLKPLLTKKLNEYIISESEFDRPIHVPSVSGCFMLFRYPELLKLNGFDERFFMYFEDIDISRRACHIGDVVIDTNCSITHLWAKGSYKSFKLTYINIVSALKYFLKWSMKSKKIDEYKVKLFKAL